MTLTNDDKSILMGVLVDTDVLFLPFRFSASNRAPAAAVAERRALFALRGIPLVGGGSATDRKSFERQLSGLAAAGLLEINRTRSRSVFGKFTPGGDDVARTMFPSSRVDEAWPHMERLRAVEIAFGAKSNAGFIAEHDVIEPDKIDGADSRPFLDLEDSLLPLLARGYVESYGDAVGRIGYRTTTSGRAALSKGKPSPIATADYCPELADAFIAQYCAAEVARNSWTTTDTSHVFIPLSAGRWPKRPQAKATASEARQ